MPPPQREVNHPFQEFDVVIRIGDHPINNEGMVTLDDDSHVPYYSLIPELAQGQRRPR